LLPFTAPEFFPQDGDFGGRFDAEAYPAPPDVDHLDRDVDAGEKDLLVGAAGEDEHARLPSFYSALASSQDLP
jgi:hypothetical protein